MTEITADDRIFPVYVQVDAGLEGMVPESAGSNLINAAEGGLKDVARLVKGSCSQLITELSGIQGGPKELTLEFGINVGAEGSVPFITKGSIGANFKVSLKWAL